MAYDENLAARIRSALASRKGITEKKMFGGLAFLEAGRMLVGVHGADLIVRVDPADHVEFLAKPGARPFTLSPRPAPGWLLVGPVGTRSVAALAEWIGRASPSSVRKSNA